MGLGFIALWGYIYEQTQGLQHAPQTKKTKHLERPRHEIETAPATAGESSAAHLVDSGTVADHTVGQATTIGNVTHTRASLAFGSSSVVDTTQKLGLSTCQAYLKFGGSSEVR